VGEPANKRGGVRGSTNSASVSPVNVVRRQCVQHAFDATRERPWIATVAPITINTSSANT